MNIYDIAAKCGVSIATVSRVLNSSPSVRPQTRDKVLAVMQEENYAPNAFAQGLGLGSMKMVGVLCADLRDPFHAQAVAHVEEYLREKGMTAILRCTGSSLEKEKQAMTYLLQRHVDAAVLIGCGVREDGPNDHIAEAARRIPLININSFVELPGVYCVTSDEKTAVADLVGRLMGRQRRRILFLYDQLTYSNQQKLAGYQEGYAAAGLQPDNQLVVQVERDLDAVNVCIKHLLVKGVSFDAVIGSQDILALGTQKALQRIGLSMPIIGFDNSTLARCATPELTSVDNNPSALCATAMAMLSDLLNKKEAAPHAVIPTQLVERDTFRSN